MKKRGAKNCSIEKGYNPFSGCDAYNEIGIGNKIIVQNSSNAKPNYVNLSA